MTADHDSNTSESFDESSDAEDVSTDMSQGERVAKALARAGVASRREVERYIEDGRVALNGVVLTTPAIKVAPGDVLTVDGRVVQEAEATRVWRYSKPNGLMTTHNDPKGRPTVFENLPASLPRVISIGRLDLNSEGLLLLTNDGELARALELPTTGLKRRYRARAHGHTTQEKLDKLKDGMTVDGVHYGSIEATLDKSKEGTFGSNLWITVTLSEGKNREVRRVLEALGLTVNRLIRLAYGPFSLGELAPGDVEEVGPRVIREQLADYIAADKMPAGNAVQQYVSSSAGQNGVPKSRRDPQRSKEDEPKKVYKAGWATPKIKVRPAAKPGTKRTDRPVTDKVWTPTPASRAPQTRAPSSEYTGKPASKPWASAASRTSETRGAARSGARPIDKQWTTTPPTSAERSGAKKPWVAGPARTDRTADARSTGATDAPKRTGRPTSERNWTHAGTRDAQASGAKSSPRTGGDVKAGSPKWDDKPAFDKPRATARPSASRGPAKWAGDKTGAEDTQAFGAKSSPRTGGDAKAGGAKWGDKPTFDKPRTSGPPSASRGPAKWAGDKTGTRGAQAFGAKSSPRTGGDAKPAGAKWGEKPAFDKPRTAGPASASRGPAKWAGDKAGDFKRPDRPMYGKPRTAPVAPTPSNPTPWAPRKPDDAKSERTTSDKPRMSRPQTSKSQTSKPRAPGKPSSFNGKPRPKGPAR